MKMNKIKYKIRLLILCMKYFPLKVVLASLSIPRRNKLLAMERLLSTVDISVKYELMGYIVGESPESVIDSLASYARDIRSLNNERFSKGDC